MLRFTSSKFYLPKTWVLGVRWLSRLVLLFGEMGEALPEGISAQQNAFATAWLSLLTPERAETPRSEMCPTIRQPQLGETNLAFGLSAL